MTKDLIKELEELQDIRNAVNLAFKTSRLLPAIITALKAGQTLRDENATIFLWLLGEKGDFPSLAERPHYKFRTELRERRDKAIDKYDSTIK